MLSVSAGQKVGKQPCDSRERNRMGSGVVSVQNFSKKNQEKFIYPTDSGSLFYIQLTEGKTKSKLIF